MSKTLQIITQIQVQGQQQIAQLTAAMNTLTESVNKLNQNSEKLGKKIDKIGSSVNKTNEQLSRFGGMLNQFVNSPLQTAQRMTLNWVQSLGGAALGLGVTAAAIGVAGVAAVKFAEDVARSERELYNFALRLDISVQQARSLQMAAKLTGVDLNVLERSSRQLGMALEDPAGSGKKAAKALADLGIATYTLGGQQRELGDVFNDVLEHLSHITDKAKLAYEAQILLGRGAKEVIPLIEQYKDAKDAADRFASQLDGVNETLLAQDRAFKNLSLSFDVLKTKFAAGLHLDVVINAISNMLGQFGTSGQGSASTRLAQGGPAAIRDLNAGPDAFMMGALGRLTPAPGAPFSGGSGIPVGPSALANTLASGQVLSDRIRKGYIAARDATKEGLEGIIKTTREEIAKLDAAISGGEGADAAKRDIASIASKRALIESAQNRIRAIDEAQRISREQPGAIAAFGARMGEKDLDPISRLFAQRDEFARRYRLSPGSAGYATVTNDTINAVLRELVKINQETEKAIEQGSNKGRIPGSPLNKDQTNSLDIFDEQVKSAAQDIKEALRVNREIENIGVSSQRDDITRRFSRAGRMAQISGLPGDVGGSIQSAYDARVALAQKLFALDMQRFEAEDDADQKRIDQARAYADLRKEQQDAELERETAIAEARRAQMDALRGVGSGLFNAARSRGGLQNFFTGGLNNIGSTVAGNLFANVLGPSILHGIDAFRPGSGSFMGKMLAGTPFGPNNLNAAQVQNTNATVLNTQATQQLTATIGQMRTIAGGGTAGGGVVAPGLGGVLTSLPGAAGASGDGSSVGLSFPFSDGSSGSNSVAVPMPFSSNASSNGGGSLGTDLGMGVTAAAGTYGAVRSFMSGGARNVTAGVGSLAGTAGALMMMAGMTGPAAPIVAGVGAALGMISSLFGDPKANRQAQLDRWIRHAHADPIMGKNYTADTSGNMIDYDQTGMYRGGGGSNVTMNINALDSQSIVDRSNDIANAVTSAVQQGHPVNSAIRQAVTGG